MAICSYLAYPMDGQRNELRKGIQAIKGCLVEEAQLHDLLIVLTETDSSVADQALQSELAKIKSLKCLALVFMANNEIGVQ